MKNLFIAALLFVGMTTFAQEPRGERKEKLQPEQKVEVQVNKLTKDLSLNEKQTAQVKELLTKENAERQAKKAEMDAKRADGQKPSPEERDAMKKKMEEKMANHKAEMKKILTADQYSKWEQNLEAKKEKMKEKMKERRAEKDKKED